MSQNNTFIKSVLDNGVRLLTQQVPYAKSVSIGVWLYQGSRHEFENEGGLTHFAEHMIFKGTESRHWEDIARETNLLGGNVNACTSTDWVKLYARVIRKDLPDTLALFSDMLLSSSFPESEVSREREVIQEEIAQYEDIPEDLSFENYTQALWLPHSIGRPVLGREEQVASYTRDHLESFWKKSLVPSRIVISATGDLSHDEILKLVNKHYGKLSANEQPQNGLDPVIGSHKHIYLDRDLEQVSFCLGVTGPKREAENRFAWAFYDMVLGGGMGSRLFDEVRERRGLAYAIGSSIATMKDAGYLSISGSTRPEYATEALSVCIDQIEKLAKEGPTDREMEVAHRQIERTQILAYESLGFINTINAERELYRSEVLTPEEILERLAAVTRADVHAIAKEVVDYGEPASCCVGPLEKSSNIQSLWSHAAG